MNVSSFVNEIIQISDDSTYEQAVAHTDRLSSFLFVNTTYVYYSVSLSLIKIILKFKLSF